MLYDKLLQASTKGVEEKWFVTAKDPGTIAKRALDGIIEALREEIAKQADIYHAEIYPGRGPHKSLHSCPCWHQAVVHVWDSIDRSLSPEGQRD